MIESREFNGNTSYAVLKYYHNLVHWMTGWKGKRAQTVINQRNRCFIIFTVLVLMLHCTFAKHTKEISLQGKF